MKHTYSQLDLDERRKIERWHRAGVPVDVIAEKLDRHRSTIFREIARNKFDDAEMPELIGYFCVAAHGKARERRNRHRKLVRHPERRAMIVKRIKHGWSPEQIAERLAYERQSVRVCHQTIYRFAYSRDGQEIKLWRYLPESRARRRPRHARRRYGRRFSPEQLETRLHAATDSLGDPAELIANPGTGRGFLQRHVDRRHRMPLRHRRPGMMHRDGWLFPGQHPMKPISTRQRHRIVVEAAPRQIRWTGREGPNSEVARRAMS